MKTALVAGATGLIGSHLLDQLLESGRYAKVIAVSRQPLEKNNPCYANVIADLDTLDKVKDQIVADDVFCCLGTTMKKAGSKEAFRKVDFDYPVRLAMLTKLLGAKQFLLVSALGANKSSFVFYNRVKGETEDAISAVDFETVHILRPSLLLGHRTEKRFGEAAASWVYQHLGFLFPVRYEAIQALTVAHAMVQLATLDSTGQHVHESSSLQYFRLHKG